MLKQYPKFKIGEINLFAETLTKREIEQIDDYLVYRGARGLKQEGSLKDLRRMLLQIRYVFEKPLTQIDLKLLREFLAVLNREKFTTNYVNKIKANFKNYLKFTFPDWSVRFSELEDIRLNHRTLNESRINHNTLITKEDIENLVIAETRNYWRAFLLTQYEGGLRTKEVRFLKWSDLKLNVDENLSELNIFASKTHSARTIYLKEATHYINLLKQEQENLKDKGTYIFHAKTNKEKPVEKYSVNEWFRKLTERVLGRKCWNYLLRHSRASELYGLAEQNKISKDTAIRFMGHSEDMSKTYNHQNPDNIKKMLKDQVYNIENLPVEEENALKKQVNELKQQVADMKVHLIDEMKVNMIKEFKERFKKEILLELRK